jgi:hypothetical protein
VQSKTNYLRVRIRLWIVFFIAVIVILSGGTAYRITSDSLARIAQTRIVLEQSLSSFPFRITDWNGKDAPIPINIQRVAGTDDFLSRFYINETAKEWFNLYVAYTARPRTMLGHRPEICYPANGWVREYTDKIEIITKNGRRIPCLLHLFHKPGQEREERFVLNYYVVNGRLTDDESVFYGLGWRTPNIAGDSARYVAQIQISSTLESSVRKAAQEFTDVVLTFLPDENGKVGASANVYSR